MSERGRWIIPPSGVRFGWPALVVQAERKDRGNPNTFTLVNIESIYYDGYEGAHVSLPLPQARRLLELLPAAIEAAEGKKRGGPK